jgi:hypothetical protein
MKIMCSWCKKSLGEKEPFDDPSETHGKCADCIEKQKGGEGSDEQARVEVDLRTLAEIAIDAFLEDRRRQRQAAGGNVQIDT